MTQFVHVHMPSEHPGVVRAELAIEALKSATQRFDGARGTAAILLAAIVSALLVAANQVAGTWTDGHLLAAWIVMWAVGFAALALLATPARRAGLGIRAKFNQWSQRRRQAIADEQLWNVALTDARIMADISRAMSQDANRDVRGYY